MRISRFVLALFAAVILTRGLHAQLAAISISRTGNEAFATSKDTLSKYDLYSSALDDRTFYQLRHGHDGPDVLGVFLGHDFENDPYRTNRNIFLSGGILIGAREKGPAVEAEYIKESLNGGYLAMLTAEYAWGMFGTQNFAKNSFMGFYVLADGLLVGASGDLLYRPRQHESSLESAKIGPMVRFIFGPTFFQVSHPWDMKNKGQKMITATFGFNPM
jgi:hypothetical protein